MNNIYNRTKYSIPPAYIFLLIICAFFLPVSLHADAYFSGAAGGGINIQPVADTYLPALTVEAFFAGQFDLSKTLLLRTTMSVATENILGDNLLEDTPATFSLDEASLTYRGNLGIMSHYITGFIGSIDPVGSDLFLRRHFGIPSFSSKITETQRGLTAGEIYSLSGLGGSYVLRLPGSTAAGLYVYFNKTKDYFSGTGVSVIVPDLGNQGTAAAGSNSGELSESEEEDDSDTDETESLNLDLRFAGAWNAVSLDLAAGLTFPFENQDLSGEDVILLIRRADFHMGVSLNIGSSYMSSLLFQAGIRKLVFKPQPEEETLALSDIYCLIEPRFVTDKMTFSFTLFNIPESMLSKLFYVSNPLGVNVSVFSNNLSIKQNSSQIGAHITVSLPESTTTIDTDLIDIQVAPFASISVSGGKFDTALKCRVSEYTTLDKIIENTTLSIAYRSQL